MREFQTRLKQGLSLAVLGLMQASVGAATLPSAATPVGLRQEVLDDFKPAAMPKQGKNAVKPMAKVAASAWTVTSSDQVRATLRQDPKSGQCMDYDFGGVSGYAVLRRALPTSWPERFELLAQIKGSGAGVNDLQIKLIDASGENVWRANKVNLQMPSKLTELKLRSRQIDFAWGPSKDKRLKQTESIEFVVAAGQSERGGGKGSFCLAGLAMYEKPPEPQSWPEPVVTVDSGFVDFDYQMLREFNGLALRWPAFARGLNYEVQASIDGKTWHLLRSVKGSDGGLDALFLPDSEARYLRVKSSVMAQPSLTLRSAAVWPGLNAVISSLAQDKPKAEVQRGDVPRAWVGEQNYWTLVGVDGGGQRSALLSEDGALEVGRGGYSVEPAIKLDDGSIVNWASAKITHSLRDGYLPLPSVHWQHPALSLDIEAAADGPRAAPSLLGRYVLRNTSERRQLYTLMLAVRPWQVDPPQQFLSTQGGVTSVRSLRWQGGELQVNGQAGLHPSEAPLLVSGLPFDSGLSLKALAAAPGIGSMNDPQEHASGLLQFRVLLAPGESKTLGWVAPLGGVDLKSNKASALSATDLDARFDMAAAHWRERLNRVAIVAPGTGQPIANTLRTSLAHILMSRDGAALRPGTRSYARSWIRDGAMMVAGLVRLGEVEAAREFVDWYGERLFVNGKVPCCVDQRGSDPVVENDSHGQYLYAVAEVWRHSHDHDFLQRHWSRVQSVMGWMEGLRQSERGAANKTLDRAHLFGLLPPSISHEGYSDKPAYSYWDDFWALRGYKDGVHIARALGQFQVAQQWAGQRDEFQRELVASVTATAKRFHIDTIAGAADRGDFDATSSTIALNPAQAQDVLPPALLNGTFERYWTEMNARSEGQRTWTDYTPYELRNVGALLRLGQAQRAHAMLNFFFKDQRPAGWNQWAEVVLPEPREVRFLGDMPHAWVSSDYIRSALDMFAYEREASGELLIGAGVRAEWLNQGEVAVRGLSTPFGPLSYALNKESWGWRLELEQAGAPTRLIWPEGLSLPRAAAEGQPLKWQGRELLLPVAPSTVRLSAD